MRQFPLALVKAITWPINSSFKVPSNLQTTLMRFQWPNEKYAFATCNNSLSLSRPTSTPFMIFSVMHIICEGPKLDAWRSQIVTPTKYQ